MARGMPILLVTVAGRKTGTPSTTPVLYFRDGDAFVVTGSGGGSVEPQWFRNLRKAATASIEVGSERMDVSVRIARDDEYRRLWERLLEVGPFFEGYRTKAGRDMPIAVLTPIR